MTRIDGRSLISFLENDYQPRRQLKPHYLRHHRDAIRWHSEALGREALIVDLHLAAIRATITHMRRKGFCGLARVRQLGRCLLYLWKAASLAGLSEPFEPSGFINSPRLGRTLPEPFGDPGTVPHFFQTRYRPEALLTASSSYLTDCFTCFRHMRRCLGRDVRLCELRAGLLAEFIGWLKRERELTPAGLRKNRQIVLAIWRYAHEKGEAPPVPKMRPLKIPREEPDSWTADEIARILAATAVLANRQMCGIPLSLWFRAALLVCYWTGIRRGSLLRIKPAHVDREGRWLLVPADNMKSSRGKRFRLGPDAIAAIDDIWGDRELLFPCSSEGHTLSRFFRELLRAADLPESNLTLGHFHKLRRSAITLAAVRRGLGAAVAFAGHSESYVTARYLDPTKLPGNDATEWLEPLPAIRMTV